MYKVDYEERKRQVRDLFDKGLINCGMYLSWIRDILAEQLIGVLTYEATDEELSEYWS